MKTNKLFLASLLLIIGLMCVNGAMSQTATDNVTVNLMFKPIQTILVNPAQKSVNIVYETESDYSAGKTSDIQTDHLSVYSTGGFAVSVKANGDFKRTEGGTIPVSDVKVIADMGSTALGGETVNTKALSASTAETIISSDKGGTALKYNITYDNTPAGGSNSYIDKYVSPDDPESIYTATITYEIVAN